MTTEQLHQLHVRRPFEPFVIHLADGRRLPVPHPECLAYVKNTRTCVVGLRDGTYEIVDLLLVTSLRTRNGRRTASR